MKYGFIKTHTYTVTAINFRLQPSVTVSDVQPTQFAIFRNNNYSDEPILRKDLSTLDWREFEALCAELLHKELENINNCWLTKQGSDFGADIVLEHFEELILVQCKHTKNKEYNGYEAILEVYSSKAKYLAELKKDKSKLVFATNAKKLSKKTKEIASLYNVEIYSHKELGNLLDRHEITHSVIKKRLNMERLSVDT